jgi:hypothetical protein
VRILSVDNALLLATSLAPQKGFPGLIEILKGIGILITGKISALEIQQPVHGNVDNVLDAAAIHAHLVRVAVLEDDLYERPDDDRFAAVQTPEFLHVLAH